MKNELFKIGQKVRVIDEGFNSVGSNYTDGISPKGVYDFENWKELAFDIDGNVHLVNWKSDSPEIYCAYLLNYRGKNAGYVYNTGLRAIDDIIVFNEVTKVGFNTGINYISLVTQRLELDNWVSNNINAIWDNKNNCLKDNWNYYSESYLDKCFDLVNKFKL